MVEGVESDLVVSRSVGRADLATRATRLVEEGTLGT